MTYDDGVQTYPANMNLGRAVVLGQLGGGENPGRVEVADVVSAEMSADETTVAADPTTATAAGKGPWYAPFCRFEAHPSEQIKHHYKIGQKCDCPCHGGDAPCWADRRPEGPRHAG